MRDLTKTGFNSNSPMRNYIKLFERIEELEKKFDRLEQMLIDTMVRLNRRQLNG